MATKEKVFGDTKLGRDGLTDKQRAFVEFFCGAAAGNASQAYRLAGYKAENAGVAAWSLLQRPHIQAAIAYYISEQAVTPDFVKKNVSLLAGPLNSMSSVAECDENGAFIKFNFKAAIETGAMGILKSITLNSDGQPCKVELHSRLDALTLLARMLGMLTDKIDHSGTIDHRIAAANEFMRRAAANPEAFEHLDNASRCVALEPGGAGEPSN